LPPVLSSAFGGFVLKPTEVFLSLDPAGNIGPQTRRNFHFAYATGLRLQIVAWGSVSDFDIYVGFHCSKKIEKHWVN